jgi:hypothetical protein
MPTMKTPFGVLDSRYINTAGDSLTGVLTFPNEGLRIFDTNASHGLIIKPGSNLSADRILSIITGDAARSITLSGNPTLADWFDQAVKQASSPTFAGLTLTAFSGYVKAAAGVLSASAIADGDLPATIKGLTLSALATGFSIAGGTTSKTLTVPLDSSVSGTNTGDNAANSSTMYIGTTAHALNRTTAAEGLAGITSLTPATDFTFIHNSINAMTIVESGALVNTLYLKAGDVGIGAITPAGRLEISKATGSPVLVITNLSDTNTYDPQIQLRSGATPAVRWAIGFDDSDSDRLIISPTLADTYPVFSALTTGAVKFQILDNSATAFEIKEATNSYLTIDTTNAAEKIVAGKDIEIGPIAVIADSGEVKIADMAVTSSAPRSTIESLAIAIDGTSILVAETQSDGAGGIRDTRALVGTSTILTEDNILSWEGDLLTWEDNALIYI